MSFNDVSLNPICIMKMKKKVIIVHLILFVYENEKKSHYYMFPDNCIVCIIS